MNRSNIVVTYENSGSVAFVILCDDRANATDRNILLSVNTFFLKLFNSSVESIMVPLPGGHSKIIADVPGNESFHLRWTFAKSIELTNH